MDRTGKWEMMGMKRHDNGRLAASCERVVIVTVVDN
jgi:hypothetical protein